MALYASLMPAVLRYCRWAIAILLVVASPLFAPSPACAADIRATESEVKAAYVYNLFHFVQWPQDDHGEWNICLLPDDPLSASLNALDGKTAANRIIRVHQSDEPSQWQQCHVLFMQTGVATAHKEALLSLRNSPVLTITDDENDNGPRTIMFFYKDNKHIRMGIHYPRLAPSGISVSARLLKILKIRDMQGGPTP